MADVLDSKRLILRRWRESDIDVFAQMNQDEEVMEFFPRRLTRDESAAFVARTNEILREKGFGLWATEVKSSQEFIGFIGLAIPSFEAHFTPCTEIGWRLKKSAWGLGYASEGAHRALQFAFSDLKLTDVVSFTSILNERSWKVMERIGMKRDPAEDFDHPRVEAGHPLRRHVLYRKNA